MRYVTAAILALIIAAPATACNPTREWCYDCAPGKVRVCPQGANGPCYCVTIN